MRDNIMETFLCKLDPRTKILIILLFSIVIFIINKLPVAAFLLALSLLLRFFVKIPSQNRRYYRFMLAVIVFILLLQMLFGPGERYIIKPLIPDFVPYLGGIGSLKWDGILITLIIGCRLIALLALVSIFTVTTGPYQIALGLNRLGLNYRTSYIIVTTFNLIPLFRDEARNIVDAQKLRGMDVFEKGSFIQKLKAYPSLAIPLVLGAMRKAQIIGTAIDARAFGVYKTRTWFQDLEFRRWDYLIFAVCSALSVILLSLNFLIK